MKIYVPESNTYNKCYVVQSEGVIRGYDRVPTTNTSYNYRDYYVRTDYIYRDNSGSWGQYATLPVCLQSSEITHDIYYRYDFSSICIIFMTMFFIVVYLPWVLFKRFFRRLK